MDDAFSIRLKIGESQTRNQMLFCFAHLFLVHYLLWKVLRNSATSNKVGGPEIRPNFRNLILTSEYIWVNTI
jgi:hypothetical protein